MSPARPIDGTGIARQIRGEVASRAAGLAAAGHLPALAVILVGSDPASQIYVKHKVKACEEAGIQSLLETCAENLSESDLLARIAALNADPSVHGILVQMPLPKHIAPAKVIEARWAARPASSARSCRAMPVPSIRRAVKPWRARRARS